MDALVPAQVDCDRHYTTQFVRDLAAAVAGHLLGFRHNIYHLGPPVEIERVDVPLRLEKRLAHGAGCPALPGRAGAPRESGHTLFPWRS